MTLIKIFSETGTGVRKRASEREKKREVRQLIKNVIIKKWIKKIEGGAQLYSTPTRSFAKIFPYSIWQSIPSYRVTDNIVLFLSPAQKINYHNERPKNRFCSSRTFFFVGLNSRRFLTRQGLLQLHVTVGSRPHRRSVGDSITTLTYIERGREPDPITERISNGYVGSVPRASLVRVRHSWTVWRKISSGVASCCCSRFCKLRPVTISHGTRRFAKRDTRDRKG